MDQAIDKQKRRYQPQFTPCLTKTIDNFGNEEMTFDVEIQYGCSKGAAKIVNNPPRTHIFQG